MADLLQSEGWERFQRALGRKTERVDGMLAIEIPLPFGLRYRSSPRSSFPRHPEVTPRDLTSAVEHLAQEKSTIFWRAEFPISLETRHSKLVTPAVLRRQVEPEWTWRTSLEGSDEERLAAMHEKHRYNVRLAERRGVRVDQLISESVSQEVFGECWALLQETARRQGISTHPRHYYETMLMTLPDTRVYFATHSGTPIACAVVVYHGDTATYLHGGSSYEHRALMAPHLLHWQAMRDSKAAGMRWYDWGGIQPMADSRKPEASARRSTTGYRLSAIGSAWSGLTRFKQGFGGEAVHHSPTMDLVFRPNWYRLLSWMAKLRT